MIEIEGLEGLKDELEKLEKKIINKTIRKAQRDACKLLASEVKAQAPIETGATKASVKVRAGRRKKNVISTIVEVGAAPEHGYVGFVELGTRSQAANPFVRHSVASEADAMGSLFAQQLKAAIENND